MRRLIILLLSAVLSISAFAQQGSIQALIRVADSLRIASPDSFDFVLALDAVAGAYFGNGDYSSALPYREECLETISKQRDDNDDAVLLVKRYLADNYSLLNRSKEAIDLLLQCAGVYSQETPQREEYINVLNSLVATYCDLDDIPSAIQYRSQAVEAVERLFGKDISYATHTWLLGELFASIKDYEAAVKYFEQSKELFDRKGERESDTYIQLVHDLFQSVLDYGDRLYNDGQLIEARAARVRAVELSDSMSDCLPFIRALCHKAVGDIDLKLGNYETAYTYIEEALDLYTEEDKEIQKEQYISALSQKAICLNYLQRYDEELPIIQEVVNLVKDKYGTLSFEYALNLDLLGQNLFYLGDYRSALDNYLNSKSVFSRIRYPKNVYYEFVPQDIVSAYVKLEEYDAAIKENADLILYYQDAYGVNSLPAITRLYLTGSFYEAKSDVTNADKTYLECWDQLVAGGHLNTPEAAEIIDVVTQIYIRNKDYKKASSLREQRGEIVSNVYGKVSSEYAENLKLSGSLLFLAEDYSGAIDFFSQSIEMYEALDRTQDPVYTQAVESLAYARLILNDPDGSISDGTKALEASEKKYGKNSMEYAQVLSNLGDAYYTRQLYDEALESYKESYSIVLMNHKTEDHLYEHLIEALPHSYLSVGNYEQGIHFYEIYRDDLSKKGQDNDELFEFLLHDLAAKSLYLSDYDHALTLNKDYITYLDAKGKKNEDYARALSSIAYLFATKDDADKTKEYVDASNTLFRTLNLVPHVDMVSNSAYMYAVTKDDKWVDDALKTIVDLGLSDNDEKRQLRNLYVYLARVDNNHNKSKAIDSYNKLLELDLAIFDRNSKEYIEDLYHASLASLDNNPEESLSRLLMAKNLIEENGGKDANTYASVLFTIGVINQNMFAYNDATSYYEKALYASKSAGNSSLTQAILNNAGQVGIQLGDFAKAVSLFEEMLEYAQKNPENYQDICQSLDQLGRAYLSVGDYNKAIRYYEDAREIALKNEDGDYILSSTLGIGSCYESQRKYDDAVSELEKYKKYGSSDSLKTMLPIISLTIANEYLENGEYQKAEALFSQVEEDIPSLFANNPKLDGALNYALGLYYLNARNFSKSRSSLIKAQDIWKSAFGESYDEYIRSIFLMGVLDLLNNDGENAVAELDRAKELFISNHSANNPMSYNYTFYPLFARYVLGMNVSRIEIKDYIDFEKRQAEELFFQMTGSERSSFWDTHSYSKNLVYSVGSDKGYADVMYDYALFYKGILLDTDTMLGNAILNSGNNDIISKYISLLSLKEQAVRIQNNDIEGGISSALTSINAMNSPQHETIYTAINKLERDLVLYAGENFGVTMSYGVSYYDVSNSLTKNEVAVEFVDYEKISKTGEEDSQEVYYCALVVKPDGKAPSFVPLCTQSEINDCIKIGENAYDYSSPSSGMLYDLIWKPLEKFIKKGSTVYFSPAGSLSQIALESIATPQKKPLSESYSLYRVSSTKRICQDIQPRPFTSSVLYGGLQYDMSDDLMISQSRKYSDRSQEGSGPTPTFRGNSRSGWGYLPGTMAEIEALSDLFKQKSIRYSSYTGIYGNEESFKSLSGTDASIIHLATHGFYVNPNEVKRVSYFDRVLSSNSMGTTESDPMKRSGLILSGGNMAWQGKNVPSDIEDGVLTAEEISNMHLENTELVVLSACESGLGDLSSDGVMGVQRAFKNAGVQTLIMSLWKVDDNATKLLMTSFYQHLLDGDSKRAAFDKAKAEVRKDSRYSNPHYWAAFIMLD